MLLSFPVKQQYIKTNLGPFGFVVLLQKRNLDNKCLLWLLSINLLALDNAGKLDFVVAFVLLLYLFLINLIESNALDEKFSKIHVT